MSKEEVNPMLQAALEYRARGLSVIPLIGKKPAIEWKEYQKRLPTIEEIMKWFDGNNNYNVGIVTGKVSGIAVLDVDGIEGLESLERAGMKLPKTPTVITGNGGWHFYFRYPEEGVKTKAGVLHKVDIRGEGGLVVAPPSVHPITGVIYEYKN